MSTPPLNPLVTKIRAKYPGAYDDMDDATLTKSVLKKYPQYSDLAAPPMPAAPNMIQKQEINNPASPNFKGGNVIPGSFEGSYSSGDTGQAAAMTGAGVAAGAALAPPVQRLGKVILKTAPYIAASDAINWARNNVPLGRYIPKSADMIPLFMAGGKAAGEGAAAEEAAGTRIPAGNLTKEVGAIKGAPDMKMVDSTNIQKIGYNADKEHLWVEFRNGRTYRLKGVPSEMADQFQNAESHGSFYSRQPKGRYSTEYMGSTLGKR